MKKKSVKIKVAFKHDKKHPHKHVSISSYHFGDDSSTGPITQRGEDALVWVFEIKNGDTIEFTTTKFSDEFNIYHKRRGRVVNGISEKKVQRQLEAFKKKDKALKKKTGKDWWETNVKVIKESEMKPKERKHLKKAQRKAREIMRQKSVKRDI